MKTQEAIEAAAFAVAHPDYPYLLATLSGSYLNLYVSGEEGTATPIEAYSTGWQRGLYDEPPIDDVYRWVMETIEWYATGADLEDEERSRPVAPEGRASVR